MLYWDIVVGVWGVTVRLRKPLPKWRSCGDQNRCPQRHQLAYQLSHPRAALTNNELATSWSTVNIKVQMINGMD